MTISERAVQIWPLLTYAAAHRQTITYELLGRHIGVPRMGLGPMLEPIQALCVERSLPPLTSIVVSDVDGDPGEGFSAAPDVARGQAAVFRFRWVDIDVPSADDYDLLMRRA